MNKTPFEIRLTLLQMAKEILAENYYAKREKITRDYEQSIEATRLKIENQLRDGKQVDFPEHPGFPDFATEDEILKLAEKLNTFVSKVNN